MKLPRDLSARELIKALSSLGYRMTRQKGAHIRVTTQQGGNHHVTIPDHNPIRVRRSLTFWETSLTISGSVGTSCSKDSSAESENTIAVGGCRQADCAHFPTSAILRQNVRGAACLSSRVSKNRRGRFRLLRT